MAEHEGAPSRLFLALAPSLDLRRKLGAMAETLQSDAWSLIPVESRDFHLTLHFLGATPARLVDDLKRDLGALCHARRPFDLRAGGLGCFPDDANPRVLWVGVLDRAGKLRELFEAARRVLDGYRLFKLPANFTPHFTVARVERLSASWDPRLLRGIARQWDDLGAFGIEEVLLRSSRTGAAQGPRYETLAALDLGGA
ncbi:MAG: RNA 2',3'-cyclic phosphodiesterase [bacterium]